MVRLAARCKQRQNEREGGGCERKTDGKKEVQCRGATGALRSPSKKEGHQRPEQGLAQLTRAMHPSVSTRTTPIAVFFH